MQRGMADTTADTTAEPTEVLAGSIPMLSALGADLCPPSELVE